MKKQIYQTPTLRVVEVYPTKKLLLTLSGSDGLKYAGGGDVDARVKGQVNDDIWDDEW